MEEIRNTPYQWLLRAYDHEVDVIRQYELFNGTEVVGVDVDIGTALSGAGISRSDEKFDYTGALCDFTGESVLAPPDPSRRTFNELENFIGIFFSSFIECKCLTVGSCQVCQRSSFTINSPCLPCCCGQSYNAAGDEFRKPDTMTVWSRWVLLLLL